MEAEAAEAGGMLPSPQVGGDAETRRAGRRKKDEDSRRVGDAEEGAESE
jgi:hypothetical protein